ncbi:unnamed protein product [Ectocarpus sp. 12 AP-2014]
MPKIMFIRPAVVGAAMLSAVLLATDQQVSAFSPVPAGLGTSSVVGRGHDQFERGFLSNVRGKSDSLKIASSAEQQSRGEGAMRTIPPPPVVAQPPFDLPLVLEECPMCIPDPEVRETDAGYALTFNLPSEISDTGLEVSVSGRLLTIEARTTREENHDLISNSAGKGSDGSKGWVMTRCTTKTNAAVRSFTLPDSVSNEVTASWGNDNQVVINLTKVAHYDPVNTGGMNNVFSTMEDSGVVPVERRHGDDQHPSASSSAAEYVYGSKLDGAGLKPSSILELDLEFRSLVRDMWHGDGAVRFPTEEQVAATVARARKERKKIVTALRRATMATDVSEKELEYVVKFALPQGATRDDVELMVTPDNNGLRVAFFGEGNHMVSKAVYLPSDASFSDISARFTPEPRKRGRGGAAGGGLEGGKKSRNVAGLEVAVGRAAPQLPKSIEIK